MADDEHTETPEPEDSGSDIAAPDFTSPTATTAWYGQQIIQLLNKARREKALVRLRALAQSLDVWRKLYELSAQTSELEALKQRLESLEAELNRSGPQGIVKR